MKFLDISKQDLYIKKKIFKNIEGVIKKSDFILGEEVNKFEKNFAKFCGAKFGVGCANGTDALIMALESLNLPKNSEVIVPAMTWCSTAFAVIKANLKPVLVDIKSSNPTICPSALRKKITKKTRAIIIVHLYGECCDVSEIKKVIKGKNIFIIEDAAQAHGAYDLTSKKKVGNIGDLACFSFYPGKNLGAYGDGGIITTNKKKNYDYLIKLRNMGQKLKNKHDLIGINSRLDTMQAVILNEKLKKLNRLNANRVKIANFYLDRINNRHIVKLKYTKGCVYHQFVIKVKQIKKFLKYLESNQIPYGRHYPNPIHKLKVLKKYFYNEKYPNSEYLASYCVSLPIDPLLKKKDLSYICNTINKFK